MRRGVGIGRSVATHEQKDRYKLLVDQSSSSRIEVIKPILEDLKTKLVEFASKHKAKINQDSHFRQQFFEMCSIVGVDPLSSNKGFWAELLGTGDFFINVSVQVLTVAMASRNSNGGILELSECVKRVNKLRGSSVSSVTADDIRIALEKVSSTLGSSVNIIRMGNTWCIISVPEIMGNDELAALERASYNKGWFSFENDFKRLGWTEDRYQKLVEKMERDGLVWLDSDPDGNKSYWFYSIAIQNI